MAAVFILVDDILLVEHGVFSIVCPWDAGHAWRGSVTGQVIGSKTVMLGNLR